MNLVYRIFKIIGLNNLIRFGENKKNNLSYKRRIGVYGLLIFENKLILTGQTTRDKTLEIQLPGGGVDKGEHIIHALHREVLEETGWHIKVLRREGVFQRFTYMPEYNFWAHKICHIYRCKPIYLKSFELEEGHRYLISNFTTAIEQLEDPGFKHFVKILKNHSDRRSSNSRLGQLSAGIP